MENTNVFEIAICRLKPEMKENLSAIRINSLNHLKQNYSGLISIIPLKSTENDSVFADLCEWDSVESAKNAAAKVMTDPEMISYFETIETVLFMEHFKMAGNKI